MTVRRLHAPILALLFAAPPLASADCPDWKTATLSGDWSGARTDLCGKGMNVEITHKSDLLLARGGAAAGSAWLMNTEAVLDMDLSALAGWDGASALVHYHIQHGSASINRYAGSYAGVSNIETGTGTGQFYQAWLQRNFAGDSVSLLGGLYAIDSEFYVTESSGLFLQPPYGMGSEIAQSGRNGPPIFPMGALGVRAKYGSGDFHVQGALSDGVPGNPDDPHGTHIRLGGGDGTLSIAEFAYAPAGSKTALGLWRYSARADDLTETDAQGNPLRRTDAGMYLLAERLLAGEADSARALSGFVRFGMANKHVHQSDWSASLGLNYRGPFDGRADDAAGIAIATSHAGAKYRQLNASAAFETLLELTYRAQLQPWLAVQPSLQYIHTPNMDPALKDAWVAGARFEAAL